MYKNSIHRFKEIVRVLASYGFGYIVDSKLNNEKKSPENLRKAFEELGPTFIKIGQILSTRPDILPSSYIAELSKLQDDVLSESFENMNKVFVGEFHKAIKNCFAKFDEKPIASASVAQVYAAVLDDETEVIVKIQRPYIYDKMHTDISILNRILKFTKVKFSDALLDPKEALDEILAATELELDFRNEAKNLIKFGELNKDVACVCSPSIISQYSSTRVVTMERIHGLKITNTAKLKEQGYDLNDIGKKLALSYLKQIFKDGFFHGDPHPGNLIIKEGKICYIDFGLVGSLNASLRSALNEAMISIACNDVNKFISVLMSICIKTGYVNRNRLFEDIDYLFQSYLESSFDNIKISIVLQEVFDTAKRNNLRLPKDLTILIRGMIILEGVASKIAPEIKIIDIIIPFAKANSNLSFIDLLDFNKLLIQSYNFIKASSKLPSKIIEVSDGILNGRAKIQFQVSNLDKSISQLNKMINRLVFALIISSMIIGSSLILKSNMGPKIFSISVIGILGFGIAAFMSLWLMVSIIKSDNL